MTGNSDMPTTWKAVLAAGLAVLTAATVSAVVFAPDPADADTRIASARNAVLVAADGTETAARDGDLVPPGASVRTGVAGGVRLVTSDRAVYLGSLSTVDVTDGVRQRLTNGQVMIDARNGPRLELTTQAGTVRANEGALARVERGASLRLAVLDGSATFKAAGRKATSVVPEYYQIRVPYGAVAGRATAMALTPGDRWERELAADLVLADTDLNRFAVSLDGEAGLTVLASLQSASFRPSAGPRSEQALEVALASAAGRPNSLETVVNARAEGGSWGIVAAIAGARVTAVSALLDRLLGTNPDEGPVLAGGLPDLRGIFGGGPGVGPGSGGTPPPGRDPRAPSRPTTPPPTTSPPTTSPPIDPDLPEPVPSLLDTVLRLLPTPTPVAVPNPVKTPTVPLPLPTLGPVLDLDLG